MFKALSIAAASLSASVAFGHGSIPHQSADAVEAAIELFEKVQPSAVRKEFLTVSARWMSYETFHVAIGLKNGATFNYKCVENEDVEPVVWECKAL